ncbi:MAG: YncE family protein [Planctomycetota bacterium]
MLSTALALAAVLPQSTSPHALPPAQPPTSAEGDLSDSRVLYDAPRRVGAPALPGGAAPAQGGTSGLVPLQVGEEGDMPRDVAFTPDGQRVVIANRDSDNVTVLDFQTRQVLATLAVGDFPVDVDVAPDGSVAVVPNLLSDTVSIIDLATLTVAATVPVTATGGGQPYRVQIDATSSFCLVGVIEDAIDSRFSVIDLATGTETRSFQTSSQGAYGGFFTPEPAIFGNLFTDWQMSSDGSFVLLPDRGGDVLNSYDVATGALLGAAAVGDVPSYVDIADDRTQAVVSLSGAIDGVVRLSLAGGVPTIVSTTPTANSAFDPRVRLTPDGAFAVVAVQNAVEFIDLATSSSIDTVSTGTVGDLEFTFDDQFLVVTNFTTRVIRLSDRSVVRAMSFAATYDAAVSPVSHRLVGLNNRFREDAHFYTTDGASSQFEGRALSGPAPEMDAPRRLAVTPDGTRALVVGNTSRSVVDVDLATGAITATYPIGDRGWEVATDAAGTVAVVTSTETSEVQVIDLVQQQLVATLSVPSRPTEVIVSDDGTEAYVTTVAGTDRVWFLDLAGAASSVGGSVLAGQLGTIGWARGTSSGIALSPDGATLALCVSFDDQLRLIDVASRTIVTNVPVGDFPIRAAWRPDGSQVVVSNAFDDTVSVVDFAGAASAVSRTIAGVEDGFALGFDESGDEFYVTEYGFGVDNVRVENVFTSIVTDVAVGGRPAFAEALGRVLILTVADSVAAIRLAAPFLELVDTVPISEEPSDLALSVRLGLAVTAQPGANDAIDLTSIGGVPANECGPAVANSTGVPGTISASGFFLAGVNPFRLTATDLPRNSFGYFVNSITTGFTMNPGGSQGNLCLGGTIGRHIDQVMSSGQDGRISIEVDSRALPSVPTFVPVVPGETWSFQLWYRDANPGVTSNFTDRVTMTFE